MGRGLIRWLCIAALLTLFLGARTAQTLAVPNQAQAGSATVAIVRVGDDVHTAVRSAVALAGGLQGVVRPGDTVVVKVNLVRDISPESGMVTDPAVAREVVSLAREAGAAQVILAEGTAEYLEGDPNRDRFCTKAAFRTAGYDLDGDMVDDATGTPLLDLNDTGGTDLFDTSKVTRVIVPTGLIRKEYWLPNSVLDADVLISVPVLKNHYLAGVTLGMKNLIGLLPNDLYHAPGNVYGRHSLSHSPIELDQHIVDVNLARRPDFVVVDGQRGMMDGPTGSQIIDPQMGLVLAGRDVFAVDTVGSLLIGYEPSAIPYLQLAARSGLGIADTSRIHVLGVALGEARRDFPAPYADSPARRADAQPPTVVMAASAGDDWPGEISVVVDAQDNDKVARVELYMDEHLVAEKYTPPYEFSVGAKEYIEGPRTLRAVAYDKALNQSAAVDTVIIPAPSATTTLPPTASATSQPEPTPTVASAQRPTSTEASTTGPAATVLVTPLTVQSTRTHSPTVIPISTDHPPTAHAVIAVSTESPAPSASDSPTEAILVPPAEPSAALVQQPMRWLVLIAGATLAFLVLGLLAMVFGLASRASRRRNSR